MKFPILLIITCFLTQLSFAQTNNLTITCPENTFLGIVDECLNFAPDAPNQIEEVTAPPYNMLIEGDIPERLRVRTQDDNTIFVCEEDARIVNREVIIFEDTNINFAYDVGEEVGICNYTIETEQYLTVPEFTPPPDVMLDCGAAIGPEITGDVTVVQFECTSISDGVEVRFSDVETVEGNITTIKRTWTATNFCDIKYEQVQTITINCETENDYTITCPENTFLGVFSCEDIDELPPPINTIEEAMSAPYNIQIEGVLPENAKAISEDDGVIFFCESNPRVVTREIIIYTGYGGFEPTEVLARCSFTIETLPDTTSIDFIAFPDFEMECFDNIGTPDGLPVTITGDDCFAFDDDVAFFTDEITEVGNDLIVIRTWNTVDACGNLSEPQEQIITLKNCSTTIACPENTFLGVYDCSNIEDVPDFPNAIEEAIAPPYSIQIEGDLPERLRATTQDDNTIFVCESNARIVNREVIIYNDVNINFVYDVGEEIGICNYTIETIPDISPPEFIAPSDIEIPCGLNPEPSNTGDFVTASDNCEGGNSPFIDFYDEIEAGDITTILRNWTATDFCGNSPEPQIQTITINCENVCIPPNVGAFECGN